jgi:hypothetical protein
MIQWDWFIYGTAAIMNVVGLPSFVREFACLAGTGSRVGLLNGCSGGGCKRSGLLDMVSRAGSLVRTYESLGVWRTFTGFADLTADVYRHI